MTTTYRLNPQEMTMALLDSIKTLFADQETVEITIKTVTELDSVTILSQKTLAEEWDSTEDERWGKLL
jgi:hypothetical protein